MKNIFDEFNKTSKAEWLNQVTKDLKGQPMSGLFADFGEGLVIDPFLHEQDRIPLNTAIDPGKTDNTWLISEKIETSSPELINTKSLTALEGGASALSLTIDHLWSVEEFTKAFRGIYLDYIFVHFDLDNEVKMPVFLSHFEVYLQHIGIPADKVKGSFSLHSALHANETLLRCIEAFPGFKFLCFSSEPADHVADELTHLLLKAEEILNSCEDIKNAQKIPDTIVFEISTNNDFYLNIAKVKALKQVWQAILKSYQLKNVTQPFVKGIIKHLPELDPNTAVIQASAQALSLSIAGADLIEIEPFHYDQSEFGEEFPSRIARNIHHILQLESFMDKAIDPAGGSYFIDHLTQKLAQQVWDKFKQSFITA